MPVPVMGGEGGTLARLCPPCQTVFPAQSVREVQAGAGRASSLWPRSSCSGGGRFRAAPGSIFALRRPPLRSLVMLGRVQSRVVRNLEEGFAIEFVHEQMAETLEDSVTAR